MIVIESIDCFALFFLLCVAKASSTLSIGLTNRVNATTAIAIDATKSFCLLVFVFVLVVNICFIHIFDTIEKIYWDC